MSTPHCYSQGLRAIISGEIRHLADEGRSFANGKPSVNKVMAYKRYQSPYYTYVKFQKPSPQTRNDAEIQRHASCPEVKWPGMTLTPRRYDAY